MNEIVYQHWFLSNEDISYSKKVKLIDFFYDSYNLYTAQKSTLINSGLLDEKIIDKFIEILMGVKIYIHL